MDNRMIHVPVSLLIDPDLTAVTKVAAMALRLNPAATPAELRAMSGLSRTTVFDALKKLPAFNRVLKGPRVKVPGKLLADASIGAAAKVLYGQIQTTPGFRGYSGQFTFDSLRVLTKLGPNTLKRGIAELAAAGWIRTTQKSRLSPIRFRLGSPELRRSQAEAAVAARRLKRGHFGGEAIMQEYLSLLITSDQYTDNARPGFLVNPQTGERMELDRFYPPNVAFEFHGAQHFHATEKVPQAEVDAQHLRDLIKAGICLYRDIHLVIIRAEDLSLQGMTTKIGRTLPLRDLAGHEPLIDLLEEKSIMYAASARRAQAQ